MISEIEFVTSFSSFWRMIAPNSESVIKRINHSVEGFAKSARTRSRPDRRAFINEIGFGLFVKLHDDPNPLEKVYSPGVIEVITREARARQELFARQRQNASLENLDYLERIEAISIFEALIHFKTIFALAGQKVVVLPKFKGCGFLDSCEGDLLIGKSLVEVKAGDRNFRSIDVRQALTYCAVNHAEGRCEINEISCVNPRRGTYFRVDLDTLCLQIACKSSSELFSEIVYFLSSGEFSR